jgi:uncharacterized damage-inducible protein DinB
MSTLLVSLFEYKAWANRELHAALERFDAKQHPELFQAMLRTLDHVSVVDQIFRDHLSGSTPSFATTQSDRVPSLPELRAVVADTDAWYVEFVSNIGADRLQQRIAFAFTDGDRGAMSREEMLLHVITHGGYHRGSVGQMLEDTGVDSPPDSLTKFLHRHEPERRLRAS